MAAQTFDERLVTDAEAEDESVVIGGVQRLGRGRRCHGVAAPDVGDTSGDHEGVRTCEQETGVGEGFASPRFGNPHRRKAGPFNPFGQGASLLGAREVGGRGPDADRAAEAGQVLGEGVGLTCHGVEPMEKCFRRKGSRMEV